MSFHKPEYTLIQNNSPLYEIYQFTLNGNLWISLLDGIYKNSIIRKNKIFNIVIRNISIENRVFIINETEYDYSDYSANILTNNCIVNGEMQSDTVFLTRHLCSNGRIL